MTEVFAGVEWAPVFQALVTLIAALVPVLAAKLFALLGEYTKESQLGRLGEAAARGAGQVLDAVATAKALGTATAPGALVDVKEAAIRQVTATMLSTMATTIGKLGGSAPQIEAMIRGELGRLPTAKPAVAVPSAIAQRAPGV